MPWECWSGVKKKIIWRIKIWQMKLIDKRKFEIEEVLISKEFSLADTAKAFQQIKESKGKLGERNLC